MLARGYFVVCVFGMSIAGCVYFRMHVDVRFAVVFLAVVWLGVV